MKHFLLVLICIITVAFVSKAITKAPVNTNDDVILHAWCWSFNTIRQNMQQIAQSGYKYVQTPPAQNCIESTKDDTGGNQLFGHGRWYYHYQPIDWKIGNYQVGSRSDFKAMCDEARKYGIKIIVDVLPNHTAIDDSKVTPDMNAAVGGHENLYHANGFTEIRDYNNREQCTTGRMGGLPDVNTENPAFQHYFLTYLNDLIINGASGFRYDTAKHIGLPSDPLDPKAIINDFWPVVMGEKSVMGLNLCVPRDSLFIYGEVLQDKNVKEREYAEYMNVTASSYGHILREVLTAHNWGAANVIGWAHSADPTKLITWVESHDTYCNAHESASLSDTQIVLGWVFLSARQNGTPLFYSRPQGSSATNVWGNNIVGERGNDTFFNPEVVAANKFRNLMHGQPERVSFSPNKAVAAVSRGSKGMALINITESKQQISLQTLLPNGIYHDVVHNSKFIVKSHRLTGNLQPMSSYILLVQ